MEIEKVIVICDPKKVEVVKQVVETLKEKIPTLKTTPFRYGKLGEDVIISFNIEKKYHILIVKELTVNNIQIISSDPKVKEINEKVKDKSVPSVSDYDESNYVRKTPPRKNLNDFIANGDYKDLYKIAKDYTKPKDITNLAKNNIPAAVSNAIKNFYGEGLLRKFETERCIDKLIDISSDKLLRDIHMTEQQKEAGMHAIDLCTKSKKLYGKLINIANNTAVSVLVSVKAAIVFAVYTLDNKHETAEELKRAERELNIRWLSIAVNSVWHELDNTEREKFDTIINYVKTNRSR